MQHMPIEALSEIAAYFQVLAEPSRLRILNLLRDGERNVGEIAQLTGFSAANVSRHLALMSQKGLVIRENRGISVYVRVADPKIYELCDTVCGAIGRQVQRTIKQRAAFSTDAED